MALELLIGSKRPELRRVNLKSGIARRMPTTPHASAHPAAAARYLRGDLDSILQKCLIDEPHRRYQSAQALLPTICADS